jgi:hypothetical protein
VEIPLCFPHRVQDDTLNLFYWEKHYAFDRKLHWSTETMGNLLTGLAPHLHRALLL